ncbi:MAG: NAD(P)H-dependent oxidoreductase subunit E [Janthinobacterium lividum]
MADAAKAADPHAARFGAFVRPGRSLLDVLHAIQDECRYVPADAIAPVAAAMSLSRAEVHGVLTFYHYFRTSPPPATVIQLCRAEACRSMGTEQLAKHLEDRTGCRFDAGHAAAAATAPAQPGAHAASAVSLESVYCLGQCATSPALLFNDRLYAKVTPQKFDALWDARQREQTATDAAPAAAFAAVPTSTPPSTSSASGNDTGAAR